VSAQVLDVCCGSRMFWFDRSDPRAVYVDNRRERHELVDSSSKGGKRILVVEPDLISDFTALPFSDSSFAMVVFDPPHLVNNGASGWQAKKYGKLPKNWAELIQCGFKECFRVLKPEGTLIFKWNEQDIPVSKILALTPERPVVGNRCGKRSKSHWIVFLKSAANQEPT
jgi:SAM-dependent methyltransferase